MREFSWSTDQALIWLASGDLGPVELASLSEREPLSWPVFWASNDLPLRMTFDEAETTLLHALRSGWVKAMIGDDALSQATLWDCEWRFDLHGEGLMSSALHHKPPRQKLGVTIEGNGIYGRDETEFRPMLSVTEVTALWEGGEALPLPMDEIRKVTAAPKEPRLGAAKPRRKSGRKPYPWGEFQKEALRKLEYEGGVSAANGFIQSNLERHMAEWCDASWTVEPGVTSIREQCVIAIRTDAAQRSNRPT